MGFKMKGNPMARNFGIGNSPIKQKTKKVGQENEIPWEDVDKHHQEALRKKKFLKAVEDKIKSRIEKEDRPEPTFEGTDYYGPPDISRDEADKKLKKANYDYDKAFPNWDWRKGKKLDKGMSIEKKPHVGRTGLESNPNLIIKGAVKGAVTGGAAKGKKKASPTKQIKPKTGETYKQYLSRAFATNQDPYGGDVSGRRWEGKYQGPKTKRFHKKNIKKVGRYKVDVSTAEGKKTMKQMKQPSTRSTTFDAKELVKKNKAKDKAAKKALKKTTTKKVVKKVGGKLLSRAIPYAGWALLASDIVGVTKKMKKGKSFKQAVKKKFLGLD